MSGYTIGPTLDPTVAPWPVGWEQDPAIDDGHAHAWECVLLRAAAPGMPGRNRMEEVVRCATCHAPRCGTTDDDDPCMERRHHRACHRMLSGANEHVGTPATCGCPIQPAPSSEDGGR